MGSSKILGGCDVRSQEFVPVQSCHISCQLAMSQSESAHYVIADWHWTTSNTPEVAIWAPYGDVGTSQRRGGDVRTWGHVGKIGPWGMSQMFHLQFLGNGWADCVEIWYAVGDPLVTAYAVITGGISLHVRTCRDTPHTALLYLRNGSTDCVQIWYVGWGSLAECLPQVIGGVHLHVRTCTPHFCI